MYSNKSYPPKDELKNVIPLNTFIKTEVLQSSTPFRDVSPLVTLTRKGILYVAHMLQRFLKKEFFVENVERELSTLNKPTRNLLKTFLQDKIVTHWDIKYISIGLKGFYTCVVKGSEIHTDQGRLICGDSLIEGSGIHTDISTALSVALAELVERRASLVWSDSGVSQFSPQDLKLRNKSFFIKSFFTTVSVNDNEEIGWVVAKNVFNKKNILVPAHMVYFYYSQYNLRETAYIEASSNGVAAHRTLDKALLGGIYELLERDGFLMYWFNILTPSQIDIATISNKTIQKMILHLKKKQISVYLLNCKTEFNIPILVLTAIDDVTEGVCINSAAGFNIDAILMKVFLDTIRWDSRAPLQAPISDFKKIVDINQRADLWYGGYMRKYIDFLIKGTKISTGEYKNQFTPLKDIADELLFVFEIHHRDSIFCKSLLYK